MGNHSRYAERSAEKSQRGGHRPPKRAKFEEKNHESIKDKRILFVTLWLEPRRILKAEKHTKNV